MCGIMGCSFKKGAIDSGTRAILLHTLAIQNDKRGGHSWGIARYEAGDIEIMKGLGDLSDNAYCLLGSRQLFAHTRYATHGKKTVDNCHPFQIGNIIGAHNGVLYNHDELNDKYNREFEVDSMHLFAHLTEGLPFSDITGYGTIQWINKKDNKNRINLCQMKNGDLTIVGIGKPDDIKGIVWSSDDEHLITALETAGIFKYFEYNVNEGMVYFVENGELYFTDEYSLTLNERPGGKKWSEFLTGRAYDYEGMFEDLCERDCGQRSLDLRDANDMKEMDDDEIPIAAIEEIEALSEADIAEMEAIEEAGLVDEGDDRDSQQIIEFRHEMQEWNDFCRDNPIKK